MDFMGPNREEAEKIFIVVENAQGAELEPGKVVEWTATATDADQGKMVELVDSALHTTTGIGGHKVAGVVDSTIAAADIGRLQIFGPANVRASASIDAGTMVCAGSINATNLGHVTSVAGHADHSLSLAAALVGWTLEAGPNATNATVQLYCT